ncbi:MAG: hypothetical protein IJR24_02485, partial [Alloprevotella sp.]|nr:hypothetical protein [Alloprevotella sp.]
WLCPNKCAEREAGRQTTLSGFPYALIFTFYILATKIRLFEILPKHQGENEKSGREVFAK